MLNETAAAAAEVGKLADQVLPTENEIVDMGEQIGRLADVILNVESTMCQFAERMCHAANDTCSAAAPWSVSVPRDFAGQHPAHRSANQGQEGPGGVPGGLPPRSGAAARTSVMGVSVDWLIAASGRARALRQRAVLTLASVGVAIEAVPALIAGAAAHAEATAGAASIPNPAKWMALMAQLVQTMATMSGRLLKLMAQVVDGVASMATRVGQTSKLIIAMAGQIDQMASRITDTMNIVEALVKDCE